MFATILLSILLLTSLGMIFILIMPNRERAPRGAPLMGILLFVGFALLALFGALSVTA